VHHRNDGRCDSQYGECSIWKPIAPSGYHALGFIATVGYSKPSVSCDGVPFRCIATEHLVEGHLVGGKNAACMLWRDRRTHAKIDASVWLVMPKYFLAKRTKIEHTLESLGAISIYDYKYPRYYEGHPYGPAVEEKGEPMSAAPPELCGYFNCNFVAVSAYEPPTPAHANSWYCLPDIERYANLEAKSESVHRALALGQWC
jgi:hypothetical protein